MSNSPGETRAFARAGWSTGAPAWLRQRQLLQIARVAEAAGNPTRYLQDARPEIGTGLEDHLPRGKVAGQLMGIVGYNYIYSIYIVYI